MAITMHSSFHSEIVPVKAELLVALIGRYSDLGKDCAILQSAYCQHGCRGRVRKAGFNKLLMTLGLSLYLKVSLFYDNQTCCTGAYVGVSLLSGHLERVWGDIICGVDLDVEVERR